MYLREIRCHNVGWIHLALDGDLWQALVNMIMNLHISHKVGNLTTICFPKRPMLGGVGLLDLYYSEIFALTSDLLQKHKCARGRAVECPS
jgi:hypothetical protein